MAFGSDPNKPRIPRTRKNPAGYEEVKVGDDEWARVPDPAPWNELGSPPQIGPGVPAEGLTGGQNEGQSPVESDGSVRGNDSDGDELVRRLASQLNKDNPEIVGAPDLIDATGDDGQSLGGLQSTPQNSGIDNSTAMLESLFRIEVLLSEIRDDGIPIVG